MAESAYVRFVNRNYTSGDPVAGWLAAEADICAIPERRLPDLQADSGAGLPAELIGLGAAA